MPRLRTIKCEYWDSPKIGRLTFFERLLYIAMWNYADDYGCGSAQPNGLAGFAFPYDDDVSSRQIREGLASISRHLRVTLYQVDQRPYYYIQSWDEHQNVDHPSKKRNPSPDDGIAWDPLGSDLQLEKSSRESPESLNGSVAGSGETLTAPNLSTNPNHKPNPNLNPSSEADASVADRPDVRVDVREIFDAWAATISTHRKLTDDRKKYITKALKDFPKQDVLDAVRGWVHDPWEKRPENNDLDKLLRNGGVEKFRDMYRTPPSRRNGHQSYLDPANEDDYDGKIL